MGKSSLQSRASGRSRIVAFAVLLLTGGLAILTIEERPANAAVTTVKGYAWVTSWLIKGSPGSQGGSSGPTGTGWQPSKRTPFQSLGTSTT